MGGINIALSQIEIGIAYAVWSALGTLVVTGVGIFVFKESCSPAKILCLSLIIVGVVGLNLLETAAH
jgi:small multidrug resistance pump